MKTLSCDLCDHEAMGQTFDDWMESLKPHYATAHADFMKEQGEVSAEEQQKKMQQWMVENRARFDAQPSSD